MFMKVQTMESLKKSHEEYRTQSHLQSVRVTELESLLQHKSVELDQKYQDLCQAEEIRKILMNQVETLKHEKEEMEEVMGCHGKRCAGGLFYELF